MADPPQHRPAGARRRRYRTSATCLAALVLLGACEHAPASRAAPEPPDEVVPRFANVAAPTEYAGDASCAGCHATETHVYANHAMAQSFHRWTPATRVESLLVAPLLNRPTGLSYQVTESGGQLYQVEFVTGPDGKRLNELKRRMDWVMGSGSVARSYFTEENGRLFQLPLTWYRTHGWDFSPGYEVNNARFDRLLPNRCVACHASYPRTLPHLEGKYAELRDGIGCERCHGPGALHVATRTASARAHPRAAHDTTWDSTIVNPARLPLGRRMEVCEQCHVHTSVTVLRTGKTDFSYMPSQPLRDQYAFFKEAGSIDIVSHADRLRQSACFLASRTAAKPLECATCHNPHQAPVVASTRGQACLTCHAPASLAQRLARSPSLPDHSPQANCASCHMPKVQDRAVPHGTFSDHWIRVVKPGAAAPIVARRDGEPIDPFFARDRTGRDAAMYRGMGGVVYATLANSGRALATASTTLDRVLGADTVRDASRGEARFLEGVAFQQLGRTTDATRALELSVRPDSAHPERLRALAQSYARAGRAPADVERLYLQALALQPRLAWIRADYGDFLQGQDRLVDAERAYRAAVAEQPSLAGAQFNLGTALAGEGRRDDASRAFAEAVHLDPSLAAALASLVQVTTRGNVVTAVATLGSPLPSLPVRDRGPRAVQVAASATPGTPALQFQNVPPRGLVRILSPDGTVIRSLPTGDGFSLDWDLMSDAKRPVGGGLYRAQVLGRNAARGAVSSQMVSFAIVRASTPAGGRP